MEFPWFLALYHYLHSGIYPAEASKVLKQKIRRQARLYRIDGEFLRDKESERLVLHDGNAREKLLRLHEEGHLSLEQLKRKAAIYYIYDKKMSRVCKQVTGECLTCQKRARPVYKRRNYARPIRTPSTPLFMVGCDAVGPLEETESGNRYILTGIDYLTRWPFALAVPNINEETTTEFYYKQIVVSHGVPSYILTDRGQNFTSTYTRTFLNKLGCKAVATTAYRPQSNGLCERLNQTLCGVLAKLARDQNGARRWDEYLDQTLLVLRTLVNESTGFSPSQLMYGYQMVTPSVWQRPILDYVEGEKEIDIANRVHLVQQELIDLRFEARERSNDKKEKQAVRYNATVHHKVYRVGEQVLLKEEVLPNKFADKWSGPFVVVEVNNNGTYLLNGTHKKGRIKAAVNGDSLKPFIERKTMVPHVEENTAMEQFRTWVDVQERYPNNSISRV